MSLMRSVYLLIPFLCIIVACEPVTTDVAQAQDEYEARRKRLMKAGVQALEIVKLNASGDTLAVRERIDFSEAGERMTWQLVDTSDQVLQRVNYTYTDLHQVATEKHYEGDSLAMQIAYQYDSIGNVTSSTAITAVDKIIKVWNYGKDGKIEAVIEEVYAKVSPQDLKYTIRTEYVYEMALCKYQDQSVTSADGELLEKSRKVYDYNARGRKIRERELLDGERLVSVATWEHNQQGQPKYFASYVVNEAGKEVLSLQKKFRYTRDGLRLQVSTGNADGKVLEEQFYEYQYKQ